MSVAPALFHHLECPSCEWDCIISTAEAKLGLTCPLCAEDNGRDVYLREPTGPLPATVEGYDARAALTTPPDEGE